MKLVTIHFDGSTSRMPIGAPARAAGYSPKHARRALAELQAKGFLRKNPDGSFTATVPERFMP